MVGEAAPRPHSLREKLGSSGGYRGAARVVIEGEERPAKCVRNDRSGLLTDKESPEVVPGPMSAGTAVDKGVQTTCSHCTQVEGGRAERPELLPAEPLRRIPREAHDRVVQRATVGGAQRHPIDACPGPVVVIAYG